MNGSRECHHISGGTTTTELYHMNFFHKLSQIPFLASIHCAFLKRNTLKVHIHWAKTNIFLWSCHCSMWTLNWILYEPICKRCRFRPTIKESLRWPTDYSLSRRNSNEKMWCSTRAVIWEVSAYWSWTWNVQWRRRPPCPALWPVA